MSLKSKTFPRTKMRNFDISLRNFQKKNLNISEVEHFWKQSCDDTRIKL